MGWIQTWLFLCCRGKPHYSSLPVRDLSQSPRGEACHSALWSTPSPSAVPCSLHTEAGGGQRSLEPSPSQTPLHISTGACQAEKHCQALCRCVSPSPELARRQIEEGDRMALRAGFVVGCRESCPWAPKPALNLIGVPSLNKQLNSC